MRRIAWSMVVASLVPLWAAAQAPERAGIPVGELRFEAVSIRQNTAGDPSGGGQLLPSGLYTLRARSPLFLLTSTFLVPAANIIGAPGWVTTDRYDIVAQAGRPLVADEVRVMKFHMLRDRFNFVGHVEMRDRPVYALTRTREGDPATPNMKASPLNCSDRSVREKALAMPPRTDGLPYCGFNNVEGRVWAGSMTMDTFALVLGPITGRPIVNKTGLTGGFDVKLEWTAALGAPEAVSIFTAIQEQLNLRLVPATEPIEVLVVERIERPTPN